MTIKILVLSNYNRILALRPEAEIFFGLKKMGLDITIMTPGGSEYAKRFEAAGIKVIDFLSRKKFDRKEVAFIRNTIIEQKIQIIHLFNSRSIINGIKAAKGLDVKIVLYRGYTGNIHWYDPTAYLKYLHPRVDKIFCNSKAVQDQINKQLLFNNSRTITINKGHSLEWYKDITPLKLEEIPENSFTLCCTANDRPMKGITYLIEAINLIPKEIPIHLLIAGGSKEHFENLDIIKNAKKRDKIHVLGFRDDSLRIVKACDVFVSSSIKGESITKSVIEAMCLGTTPLITDIAGNKELHIKGADKLVVPAKNAKALADGMMFLYNNREQCKKWGKDAQKHIDQNVNHMDTVEKTYKMYMDLVS